MLALSLLAACANNIRDLEFYPEGGERATWDARSPDPGDTTGDDTGTPLADGAPLVTDVACWMDVLDAGPTIICDVSYEDDEGDVLGGDVYFDLSEGDTSLGSEERRIVSEASADDAATEAADMGDKVEFVVEGVREGSTYILDRITLRDAAGHDSNETAQEVSG